MTQSPTFRKAVILCAALAAASGLGACDNPNLGKTFAEIKAIQIDDNAQPVSDSPKKINKRDVDLVVTTAKDLAVGEGGLLTKVGRDGAGGKLEIAVVDPLQLPPASEPPLAVQPIEAVPAPPTTVAGTAPATSGRSIQIGSFGSLAAAQDAWRTLQAKYPGVEQYSPSFQPATTATGKAMVRLKVGPVTEPGQAERLCGQLDIRDTWCARAS